MDALAFPEIILDFYSPNATVLPVDVAIEEKIGFIPESDFPIEIIIDCFFGATMQQTCNPTRDLFHFLCELNLISI